MLTTDPYYFFTFRTRELLHSYWSTASQSAISASVGARSNAGPRRGIPLLKLAKDHVPSVHGYHPERVTGSARGAACLHEATSSGPLGPHGRDFPAEARIADSLRNSAVVGVCAGLLHRAMSAMVSVMVSLSVMVVSPFIPVRRADHRPIHGRETFSYPFKLASQPASPIRPAAEPGIPLRVLKLHTPHTARMAPVATSGLSEPHICIPASASTAHPLTTL